MTSHTITDAQIEALRTEAENAGDDEMVSICTKALDKRSGFHASARTACERAIRDAAAMAD